LSPIAVERGMTNMRYKGRRSEARIRRIKGMERLSGDDLRNAMPPFAIEPLRHRTSRRNVKEIGERIGSEGE
jgi:hypothetical protein